MQGISWLAEEQLLETGFALWNEFLRSCLVFSMPSLLPAYHCCYKYAFFLPVYHYCCQYAGLVASLAFVLPVCPLFCQSTVIVNMLLVVVNLSFLLPECLPCQCILLVVSMPSILPVYQYCCQYAPLCCQRILLVVSLSLLLPVCPPCCQCAFLSFQNVSDNTVTSGHLKMEWGLLPDRPV